MTGVERRLRVRLDDWRFWVGVAYAGVVLSIVAILFVDQRLNRESANRAATERATQVAQVHNCFQSANERPHLLGTLDAVQLNIQNSIDTLKEYLVASPSGPLVGARRSALKRNYVALKHIDALKREVKDAYPTVAACKKLQKTLLG
jgi:hypothetical protein